MNQKHSPLAALRVRVLALDGGAGETTLPGLLSLPCLPSDSSNVVITLRARKGLREAGRKSGWAHRRICGERKRGIMVTNDTCY